MNTDKKPKKGKKKRKTAFFDWGLWMLQEAQRQVMDQMNRAANGFKF